MIISSDDSSDNESELSVIAVFSCDGSGGCDDSDDSDDSDDDSSFTSEQHRNLFPSNSGDDTPIDGSGIASDYDMEAEEEFAIAFSE